MSAKEKQSSKYDYPNDKEGMVSAAGYQGLLRGQQAMAKLRIVTKCFSSYLRPWYMRSMSSV